MITAGQIVQHTRNKKRYLVLDGTHPTWLAVSDLDDWGHRTGKRRFVKRDNVMLVVTVQHTDEETDPFLDSLPF